MVINKVKTIFTGIFNKVTRGRGVSGSKDSEAPINKDEEDYIARNNNSDIRTGTIGRETSVLVSVDELLQKAVNEIPECLFGGYIDLNAGKVLALKVVGSHPNPREVMGLSVAATAILFQGDNVLSIEAIFKKFRGIEDEDLHYFKEMLFLSENLLQVFLRGETYSNHIVVFVCSNSVNQGIVLTKARQILPLLEAAL